MMLKFGAAVATLLLALSEAHVLPRPVDSLSAVFERAASPLPPSQDPFYVPPEGWKDKKAGAILRHRKFKSNGILVGIPVNLDYMVQILYRTIDSLGHPAATVTTVLVPPKPHPRRHLSYQTAYDQADWDCSTSFALLPGSNASSNSFLALEVLTMSGALRKNWIVSTSDYEGEKAAFGSGPQAAYGTLDSIRATLSSGSITGISRHARTVLFGFSGGSLATEWAAEYHPHYAPELQIAGGALGGLPVNLRSVLNAVNKTPQAGLIAASILGLARAYPDFGQYVESHLVPSKVHEFHSARRQCQGLVAMPGYYIDTFKNKDMMTYFKNGRKAFTSDIASRVLQEAGVMGHHGTPKIPLFFFKSAQDQIAAPIGDTDDLYSKLCKNGATIHYYRYTYGTHEDTALRGVGGAFDFLLDRMHGKRLGKGCRKMEIDAPPGEATPSPVRFFGLAIAATIEALLVVVAAGGSAP